MMAGENKVLKELRSRYTKSVRYNHNHVVCECHIKYVKLKEGE